MTAAVEEKIHTIVKKIVAEFSPEKVILFGSHAWGEPHADSDIDLFIIKDTNQKRLERGRAVERILMGSGEPIDALIYTPAEVNRRLQINDFFVEDVMNKGKVLYER